MKDLIKKLVSTEDDLAPAIARLFLGCVIYPHGAQKLFGVYGGAGFTGTMGFFEGMGTPGIVAFLIIMGESLGSIALIFGLFSRFMAFGIGVIMTGAIFIVHLQNGFWMNWYGKQSGEGYEYHLLAIGLALVVMLKGSGKFSLDSIISKKI